MLAANVSVFDEASAWGWALASVFVALTMHGFTRVRGFDGPLLCALAVTTGCCLLSRATTALGLCISLGLLLLWLLLRGAPTKVPRLSGIARSLMTPRFGCPILVVACFGLIAASVNLARWGNPYTVADMRLQVEMVATFPDRLPRLEELGLFNLQRLGYGLMYYFLPVWVLPGPGDSAFVERIVVLFDGFELPASSFFLSEPLTMLLAAVGGVALFRDRIGGLPQVGALALVAGLCVAPALMLIAWYMAFRYRLDFQPLFFVLSCFGAVSWAARGGPSSTQLRLVAALMLLQIASSILHSAAYWVAPFGPVAVLNTAGIEGARYGVSGSVGR